MIGNAIEDLNRENIEEHYGVLAEHFIESEDFEKGAEYSKLAGKGAQKRFAVDEAISYAKKRVFCLEGMPRTETLQIKIIDARTVLAAYYLNLNYHNEAKDAVAAIADLALEINYQKRLPMIFTAMGSYSLWVEDNYSEGVRYLSQAVKIAGEVGDFVYLWFAAYFLGGYLSANCEFEEGLHYLKKSEALSVTAKNLTSLVTAKSTLSFSNYVFHGNVNLAYQTSDESLHTAIESDDIFAKGIAYVSHGVSCFLKGFFDEAEDNLLKGFNFAKKSNHVVWQGWASFWSGEMYDTMGAYKKATDAFERAIAFFMERDGFAPSSINLSKLYIAGSNLSGNTEAVGLAKLLALYDSIKLKGLSGCAGRYIAQTLLKIRDQDMSEVEGWIRRAIESDTKNGTKWFLGRDYALYREFFKRKGDHAKAKENLTKAVEIFKECGADGWVKKYEEELASFS